MKVAILSMVAVMATVGVARAEDVEATLVPEASTSSSTSDSSDSSEDSSDSSAWNDDFLSLGSIPQIGIGLDLAEPSPRFDGTLRGGAVFRASKHLHLGGFVELHTVNFDGFDAAVGPQIQIQLGTMSALQLRGGVGASQDHGSFGEVGAQIGNLVGGISVTARRPFDGGPTEFSANLEVSSALLLLPLWLASDPFGGSSSSHSW